MLRKASRFSGGEQTGKIVRYYRGNCNSPNIIDRLVGAVLVRSYQDCRKLPLTVGPVDTIGSMAENGHTARSYKRVEEKNKARAVGDKFARKL